MVVARPLTPPGESINFTSRARAWRNGRRGRLPSGFLTEYRFESGRPDRLQTKNEDEHGRKES